LKGGEDRLLSWLRRRLDRQTPTIGDDAAVLPAGGPFAVTVDSQIAGVHFVPDLAPAQIAARLLAVNLSDLAAMGALPAYAFLALTAAPDFDHRQFFRALLAACERHRVRLAGGDLSRGAGETLVATLTLIGRKRRGARWLRRAGASPGHALWLGGTVGESAAGRLLVGAGARIAGGRVRLPGGWEDAEREGSRRQGSEPDLLAAAARRAVRRHLLPRPQLALGEWLGKQPAGAAIDVSDGLARDLHRLCRESGVGARIEAGQLPLAARFGELCAALGAGAEQLALGGGEDYVLLFTLPEGLAPPVRSRCRRIGTITAGGAVRRLTIGDGGETRRLPPDGWDHLAAGESGQAS
jgi:thiamine-monophosphate kinase